MKPPNKYFSFILEKTWELFCLTTIVGIWPRFIEPRLVSTTHIDIPVASLPQGLHGLKILQLSDIHFDGKTRASFLNKVLKKIKCLKPDIIFITGDFLCKSRLEQPEKLQQFLSALKAPYGCFAICGNHDYRSYVSINKEGEYDIIVQHDHELLAGWKRLFKRPKLLGKRASTHQPPALHPELIDLLQKSSVQLLHNQLTLLPIKNSFLNICGLGEYMAGHCKPEIAFQGYNKSYPGIVLCHNPDSIPLLSSYPGDLILAGHTHGGQINLPKLWKNFTPLENDIFKAGLLSIKNKKAYINRGLGGTTRFRWFSSPELTLFTLQKGS